MRDQLSVQNGVVYRGTQIVIPAAMQKEILQLVHSNQGIQASLSKARTSLYWPGMSAAIKDIVQNCGICADHQCQNTREPMKSLPVPRNRWQIVSADIYTLGTAKYLVCVDHYSDYFEDVPLEDLTAHSVLCAFKIMFSAHGIPHQLITDNGPPFNSNDMERFVKEWGIHHSTSSPYHSQGNGKAESAVKIAKSLRKKSMEAGRDPYLSLLEWRNTPTSGTNVSLAQKLYSRCTRTLIPSADINMEPKVVEGVTETIVNKRLVAKSYYDRKARTLPKLDIDQPVLVRPHRLGKQVTTGVCAKQTSPRSYNVVVGNRVVRRNRRDLNIIPFPKPQPPEIDLGPEEPPSSVTDQKQEQLPSRQSTSANQARTVPDSAVGQKNNASEPAVLCFKRWWDTRSFVWQVCYNISWETC